MTTRRTILKASVLGGASLFLPASATAAGGPMGGCGCGGGGGGGGGGGMGGMTCSLPSSPYTRPFQMALGIPKPLMPMTDPDPDPLGKPADYYEITAENGTAEVYPGWTVPIIGYNGQYPGPSIVATRGTPVKLNVMNMLKAPMAEPISVHLHGGNVPPESDGHPLDLIAPMGGMSGMPMDMPTSKLYRYPNKQETATLWYHDHAMTYTSQHAYFGIAGAYVLTDSEEASLNLPSGDYDVPLIIQDRRFKTTANGKGMELLYSEDSCTIMHGFLGDKILVNGRIQPYFRVANRKYRFRILNGSQARFYQLALSNSSLKFVQIGTDGGLLPAPITRTSMLISPGERIEVVIDFSLVPVGTKVELRNTLGSGDTYQVMRFEVDRRETDDSKLPGTLRPLTEVLTESMASRTRKFTMSMLGMSSPDPWGFNGLAYDPTQMGPTPYLDDVEIWEIVNPMGMNHNFHAHAIMWQLLSRNGAAPANYERGWKDTFAMPGMTTIKIIGRFSAYECSTEKLPSPMPEMGPYFYMNYMGHCHILEHEDNGMMFGFSIAKRPPAGP